MAAGWKGQRQASSELCTEERTKMMARMMSIMAPRKKMKKTVKMMAMVKNNTLRTE